VVRSFITPQSPKQKLISDIAVSKARNLEEVTSAPVEKRTPSPGLDGVNLNMAEGQVAELTFVETRAVGEDDE
jgi:hypothetical protein